MRFLPAILFLTILQGLHAQGAADTLAASAKRAMQNGLWDVANLRLEQAAAIPDLDPAERTAILILLAESLVRTNESAKAFAILEQSGVRAHPDAPFWTGQALAGMGRYSDAVEILIPLAADPAKDFREDAGLTAASLQLSLGQPEAALETLKLLDTPAGTPAASRSKLHRIEILLDLGKTVEARALFSTLSGSPAGLEEFASFLDGQLMLAEDRFGEAEEIFTTLLAKQGRQTLTRHTLAAVGRADALAGLGNTPEATESLLSFIQSNPGTPLLEPIFDRIIAWFPEKILSTDQPTLVRLSEWLPKAPPASIEYLYADAPYAAVEWATPGRDVEDLAVFSLYARAIGLQRIGTNLAVKEAALLMQRIRLIAPMHFLAPRSLITLARWKMAAGEQDQAFAIFDSLRLTAESPLIKGEAAYYDARIAFEKGDKALAATLFDEAATLLEGQNGESAQFNAALARLSSDPSTTILIQNENPDTAAKLTVDLALEKALLADTPEGARTALDAFLTANPKHPRAAEARLAITEAALKTSPPDLSLARAQLDTLRDAEPSLPTDLSPRLLLAELRLLEISGEKEETIELAKRIIVGYPETVASSEASLVLGKSFFESGNYNEARLILEKLAVAEPGTQRSQAALLLAARAAALGATAQSREEALAIFDKAIGIDGPLRSLARLEKARLNIDLNRLPVAIESLREAYNAASPDDPSRLPTGLMLAEAIYAGGETAPGSLEEALKVYDELLVLTASNPAQYFRLQYLRGLTLEKLPDPVDPTKTRLGDALSAYFSVLDRPVDPPPPEWEWFERSGFRALALLENAGRWQAAISIAGKIASFKGPRSEEAATRARQLQLKHMIYEDSPPNQ